MEVDGVHFGGVRREFAGVAYTHHSPPPHSLFLLAHLSPEIGATAPRQRQATTPVALIGHAPLLRQQRRSDADRHEERRRTC